MEHKGKIVIDCERMKYPHTGLYHYCDHLSRSLLAIGPNEPFCFYLPKKLKNIFGADQCYLVQKERHKLVFPSLDKGSLWHSTHQSTDYFPKKKNIRKVLTIHDLNYLYDERKSEKKKKKYLKDIQAKIDRCDHIIAISAFSRQDILNHFTLDTKKISVIYNGCNINPGLPPVPPANRPDKPFLFSIGTVTPKKNFHVLPSLLVNNDWQLIIVGITQSEAYLEKIKQEARALGVANRVIFPGPITEAEKYWYYQECQAFVFPSISEGFGLPVIEAMYFGKPVILSNHTCLPEIGGNAAYYFNSFEPSHMQQTLSESLHDYETHTRSAHIKQRADFFNWKNSAQQYLSIYQSLQNR